MKTAEKLQDLPAQKKNWTRKTFLIQQKRSHKMFLQTLLMLQKKLRRSKRRKERRRKLFLHPRRKKRIHKMILLQVKR